MAKVVIRQLDHDIEKRLKILAASHGHSLEQEVCDILRRALRDQLPPHAGLSSELAACFNGIGLDHEIPEWHGQKATPADFE